MPTSQKIDNSDELLAAALTAGALNEPVVIEPGTSPARRPDITPAQIIAGVPVLANLLAAFGVYSLSAGQQAALQDTLTWALALLGADALIRVGRNLSKR